MTTSDEARTAAIHDLQETLKTTRTPGIPKRWEYKGIPVTVYGQRLYELDTPTPWAVITINNKRRTIFTWEQLIDELDALAADEGR